MSRKKFTFAISSPDEFLYNEAGTRTFLAVKDGIHMLAPVDNSDHNVLIFSIDCNISQEKEKKHLCYNQADYNAMREFVKLKLSYADLSDMSASAVWYNNEVMQDAIRRFVPHRIVNSKSKNPLWITGSVEKC